LTDLDAGEKRVVHSVILVHKFLNERGVVQVDIDAIRGGEAMDFIRDFVLQIDYDCAGFGIRPVAQAGDTG